MTAIITCPDCGVLRPFQMDCAGCKEREERMEKRLRDGSVTMEEAFIEDRDRRLGRSSEVKS